MLLEVIGPSERSALVTRLAGTPAYMAPEQKTLGAQVGPWTDVYLLARTLVELLGGRLRADGLDIPFDAPSLKPTVSALQRGLQPNLTERPRTASDFSGLLQVALQSVA